MESMRHKKEEDGSQESWMDTSKQYSDYPGSPIIDSFHQFGFSEPFSIKTVPEYLPSAPSSSILDQSPYQNYMPSLMSDNSTLKPSLSNSDESFGLVWRSALEIDNTAWDHPLYHNVSTGPDGLYHCPWEGQPFCGHKPEKLKCSYE
jgi:hypothetical protein